MASPFDLELSGVKAVLPNGRPLFQIDRFAVPHGSHLLIQGESGCGKTTLLHLMAGLFIPSEGAVTVGESRIDRLTDSDRCDLRRDHIGVIFQKLNLLDHLTVSENVGLSLRVPNTAAVDAAVERVNLRGRGGERSAHLSLGEQQRIAVARVLAQNPEIVLADEPTSSLDETNARFAIEALKESARGKTLVIVSHDHRIAAMFDRVLGFAEIAK